jgi:Ser/Thr protein kinase RdoA (MazF antagonist)
MYDLGEVSSIRPFKAGSSRAPKASLTADGGRYLLKRLAPSRTDLDGLRFQHRVIDHLSRSGFPVAEVQRSRDNRTIVNLGVEHYEVSRWIDGRRYGYEPREARAAGAAMAAMHDLLEPMQGEAPKRRGYHDRGDVASVVLDLAHGESSSLLAATAALMQTARRDVRRFWSDLPRTVVHGDWHPGNLLMGADRVAGVIDFESSCVEQRVSDLANGLLQFTCVREIGTPVSAWPVAVDLNLFESMFGGYKLVARVSPEPEEIACIPSLMIEALSVETAITLRRKGRLRSMTPQDVLPWIVQRLEWIDRHRSELTAVCESA